MPRWLKFWRRRTKRKPAQARPVACKAAGYAIRIARRDHESWYVMQESDSGRITPRDWLGALCVHVCRLAQDTGLEPDAILDAARERINSPLTRFREGIEDGEVLGADDL